MRHLRRVPPVILPALLVLAGAGAALTGVYLLAGLAVSLIVGGASAFLFGLLVDV